VSSWDCIGVDVGWDSSALDGRYYAADGFGKDCSACGKIVGWRIWMLTLLCPVRAGSMKLDRRADKDTTGRHSDKSLQVQRLLSR
jgi:hypothetical protein